MASSEALLLTGPLAPAGQQNLPGAGRVPGPGRHVGGDEAESVDLPGERQRDQLPTGKTASPPSSFMAQSHFYPLPLPLSPSPLF